MELIKSKQVVNILLIQINGFYRLIKIDFQWFINSKRTLLVVVKTIKNVKDRVGCVGLLFFHVGLEIEKKKYHCLAMNPTRYTRCFHFWYGNLETIETNP
jgi:hypothetical protein